MLKYTSAEVLKTFENAKNINSAVKKFLKNEVGNDHKSEKFVKNLRSVLESKNSDSKEKFIQEHLPEYENHFFILGRYAYLQDVESVSAEVFETFAEKFNTTYSKTEKGIEIKDAVNFKKIILQVDSLIQDKLSKNGIVASNFMKNILLLGIFDIEVLKEVVPLLG